MNKFISQPTRRYRNFQVIFTILTLNFAIPTMSYIFAPDVALAQFVQLNEMLGGSPYLVDETASHLWRYLGAANVATLAFCCLLLQINVRKFYAVLYPLSFMKFLAATLWFAGFIAAPEFRVFLAAAILDYVTTAAFVFFTLRAKAELDAQPESAPVPQLGWGIS